MINKRFKLNSKIATLPILLLLVALQSAVLGQKSLTFAVIGDSGEIGQPQRDIVGQMKIYRDTRRRFDFVLMLGDNIYPDGVGRGFDMHFNRPY